MYTIGQFSRIGMVSATALRFYDEIGLLKPCRTDEANGYRYYSPDQIADLLFITEMREFGFTLEDIRAFMASPDPNVLYQALKQKHDELFHEEQRLTYLRRKLKLRIDNSLQTGDFMNQVSKGAARPMEIRLVTLEKGMLSMGIALPIPSWPPEDPEIFGRLWTRYWEEDISSQIPDRTFPPVRFGILAAIDGAIQYLITDEVNTYERAPADLIRYEIPPGQYAVCTFGAPNFEELVGDALKRANEHLNGEWLPQSGYKYNGTFALEVYDERSRQKDNPEMDVYAPISEK